MLSWENASIEPSLNIRNPPDLDNTCALACLSKSHFHHRLSPSETYGSHNTGRLASRGRPTRCRKTTVLGPVHRELSNELDITGCANRTMPTISFRSRGVSTVIWLVDGNSHSEARTLQPTCLCAPNKIRNTPHLTRHLGPGEVPGRRLMMATCRS